MKQNCSRWLFSLLLICGCSAPTCQDSSGPVAGEKPLTVGFLLLDGVYNSELMAPYDVFHHTVFHTQPGMQVFTVGRSQKPVTSFEGLRIIHDHDLTSAPEIDVLVVPSAEHNMDSDLEDTGLMTWLKERGTRARYLLSVCDGAFLLAEAGLLKGRECTTFPGDIPAFRRRYPELAVQENVVFVADGPAITGVGGARSYEPALYLVEKLYGKRVAEGVGRGLVVDWQLESVSYHEAAGAAAPSGEIRSYLPGDGIDPAVAVENAKGEPVRIAELVTPGTRALALFLMAGAEGGDSRKRGGLWCEDSYNDLPLLRHLILEYEPKGVRFVAVTCPPVYHEETFGYHAGSFLEKPAEDASYQRDRRHFVERTLKLQEQQVLPFKTLLFDPRFRLLANPERGEASAATGSRPSWQGRFKWYQDTQTYGTPTLWILKPDLTVYGAPFFMNVYESPGRKIRYTARDVSARLERLLRTQAGG